MFSNQSSSKIPFWSVYEIWEFNLLQQKADGTAATTKGNKQQSPSEYTIDNISQPSDYLVEMTTIKDMLYILIQDE